MGAVGFSPAHSPAAGRSPWSERGYPILAERRQGASPTRRRLPPCLGSIRQRVHPLGQALPGV